MDRLAWNAYRKARGARRARLQAKLLADNEALARAYATAYAKHTQYYTEHLADDLLQAARIGLLRALDGWDPEKGAFSLCAYFWSLHEMQLVVRHATGVSVPKSAFIPQKKQNEVARFFALHGRDPLPEEIGLTDIVIDRARKAMAAFVPMTEAEGVPDDSLPSPEAVIDRKRDAAALREFVEALSFRDRKDFWTGDRPELTERARKFVEERRCRQIKK